LITSLRRAGVRADMAFGARGLKGAMKAADRSGADYAVLIGTDERSNGTVRIKNLRSGDQQDVAATSASDWLIEKLIAAAISDRFNGDNDAATEALLKSLATGRQRDER